MKYRGPITVVAFTHLGYENDSISEVTYHSISHIAANELLNSVILLGFENHIDLDTRLVQTPIPGGKVIPRAIWALEAVTPVACDARVTISRLLDWYAARNVDGGRIVHLFPEFPKVASSAKKQDLITVVYARGCHPEKALELYEEERENFEVRIDIPYETYERRIRTYEKADYVLYLCDYVKQTFVSRGFSEDRLLKVGPMSTDMKFAETAGETPDRFRVLAVSNMTPLKGTKYLLDAWQNLDIRDAELVLCGSMSDGVREEVGERIRRDPSIIHLGHVDKIFEQYQRASVFVHPSLTEGFGKVYVEAMAAGLPVIATENGPVEYIDDAGLVVSIRDSKSLADKIAYLHDNPDEARRMGERGRDIVQSNPWGDFSDRVLAAHTSILRCHDAEF